MSTESSVKVCFRFRNNVKGGPNAVKFQDAYQVSVLSAEMKARGERKRQYRFDRVFQGNSEQEEVYRAIGRPLIKNIFDGYNSTLFVYGQTGSGKTYSMFGPDGGQMGTPAEGMVPRLMRDIFARVERDSAEHPELTYKVKLAIVDVYLEQVRDLQNPLVTKRNSEATNLQVRYGGQKRGVQISYANDRQRMATQTQVKDVADVMKVIEDARAMQLKTGAVAATKMNAVSSRSHLVVQCIIECTSPEGIQMTKLLLCDLAGSEKTRNTGAQGMQLEQAKNINYGLSVLGQVLNALTDAKQVKRREAGKGGTIPFRDSNLTRILQDSLGGNCKTALICTARPESLFAQETLSTLRFGNNAKKIKNKAIKGIVRTAEQWAKLNAVQESRIGSLMKDIQRQQRMRQAYERRSSIFEQELENAGVDMSEIKAKHQELQVDLDEIERRMSDGAQPGAPPSDLGSISEDAEFDLPAGLGGCGTFGLDAPCGRPGKCSCGLAHTLASERLTNENLTEQLQHRQNRIFAQEAEIAQLEDHVATYQEQAEKTAAALQEAKDLKGDLFRKDKLLTVAQQENEHLREQLKFARTEVASTSSMTLSRNIQAFRDNMNHLGGVALDDATEVLRVMHSGDADQRTALVSRISNQTAELERLKELVRTAVKQIDGFKELKQHHEKTIREAERKMLALRKKRALEQAAEECERNKLLGKVQRRDEYISEIKALAVGDDHTRTFGQQGLEAYLSALPSKNKNLRRKRRRSRKRGSGLSINTKLQEAAQKMLSPCA